MTGLTTATRKVVSIAALVALTTASTGCTHWNRLKRVTYEKEVSRKAAGGPRVEETYSSRVRSDSSTVKERDPDRRTEDTTTGTTYESVRRTRCVQDFDITYFRRYKGDHEVSLLWLDITGASLVGLAGVGGLVGSLSEEPRENTGAAVAGVFLAGSLAWFAYAFATASSPPHPRRFSGEETITLRQKLDVQGCNNLSGGGSNAAEDRLRELDALYKEGVITDVEYRRKKRDLLKEL